MPARESFRIAFVLPIFLGLASAAAESAGGDDWAQFQGPLGNGSSPERGLLRSWPEGGPKVLWRVPIKQGWGAPSVAGDDVIFGWSETRRGDSEVVVCLGAADGKEKWRQTYKVGPYWERNIGWAPGGFRSTPAIGDRHVFTLGAVGHLHCLDRKTGAVVWMKNLWEEWSASGEKGYCFSPMLADNRLLLYYGDGNRPMADKSERRYVLCRALDPADGKALWEYKELHKEPARMGEGQTPALADFGGEKCVLFTGNCRLIALRVSDGKPIWRFDVVRPDGRGTTIPTPLVLDRHIINVPDLDVTHAVAFDHTKPDVPARTAWRGGFSTFTAIHQFRHHDGYLYGFAGEITGASEQTASDSVLKLICVELATGKVMWSEPGFKSGQSLIEADGLLFVRSYQTLRLIDATPAAYRKLGEAKTHEVWKPTVNLTDFVSPVLSRGRLFIRTPEELICYDVKVK